MPMHSSILVNPQPPYGFDWHGWGPRAGARLAALPDKTVLHAGGAITTLLVNPWMNNMLMGGTPFVITPQDRCHAGGAGPLPELGNTLNLPADVHARGSTRFPRRVRPPIGSLPIPRSTWCGSKGIWPRQPERSDSSLIR